MLIGYSNQAADLCFFVINNYNIITVPCYKKFIHSTHFFFSVFEAFKCFCRHCKLDSHWSGTIWKPFAHGSIGLWIDEVYSLASWDIGEGPYVSILSTEFPSTTELSNK